MKVIVNSAKRFFLATTILASFSGNILAADVKETVKVERGVASQSPSLFLKIFNVETSEINSLKIQSKKNTYLAQNYNRIIVKRKCTAYSNNRSISLSPGEVYSFGGYVQDQYGQRFQDQYGYTIIYISRQQAFSSSPIIWYKASSICFN